jgi:predicted GIY-YIG superfamily endonuclease
MYTYDECKLIALNYKTKKELKNDNPKVYYTIYRKWYELYSHMEIIGNRYKRLIYVYEFEDNHCYVGLTGNIQRRNRQHIQESGSVVYKHIIYTGLKPKLILKTDYIDVEEASIMEGKIEQEYRENWLVYIKQS